MHNNNMDNSHIRLKNDRMFFDMLPVNRDWWMAKSILETTVVDIELHSMSKWNEEYTKKIDEGYEDIGGTSAINLTNIKNGFSKIDIKHLIKINTLKMLYNEYRNIIGFDKFFEAMTKINLILKTIEIENMLYAEDMLELNKLYEKLTEIMPYSVNTVLSQHLNK